MIPETFRERERGNTLTRVCLSCLKDRRVSAGKCEAQSELSASVAHQRAWPWFTLYQQAMCMCVICGRARSFWVLTQLHPRLVGKKKDDCKTWYTVSTGNVTEFYVWSRGSCASCSTTMAHGSWWRDRPNEILNSTENTEESCHLPHLKMTFI